MYAIRSYYASIAFEYFENNPLLLSMANISALSSTLPPPFVIRNEVSGVSGINCIYPLRISALFSCSVIFKCCIDSLAMTQAVDIKELNERIQKESSFVDMVTMEMNKVIVA